MERGAGKSPAAFQAKGKPRRMTEMEKNAQGLTADGAKPRFFFSPR